MTTPDKTGTRKVGRPPSDDSISALQLRLSRGLGFIVTPQAIRWWKRKRYDLNDLNRLRQHLLDQERLPDGADANRLRRDMAYPAPEAFGRMLRELIEGLPCEVIDQMNFPTQEEKNALFRPLYAWVLRTLKQVYLHEHCPPGFALDEYEGWDEDTE